MKVLTAAEMSAVDRKTVEGGIPSLILMENAAHRVVEVMAREYGPLSRVDVVVFCGKGNNGGDGYAIARQLLNRELYRTLAVVEVFGRNELEGDAAANWDMLTASGFRYETKPPANSPNTIVVDAILGTGTKGGARGPALEAIRRIRSDYSQAVKVSVDLPSGLSADDPELPEDYVPADCTVTFSAAKRSQVLGPACYAQGKLHIEVVGSPKSLIDGQMNATTLFDIADLFGARKKDSNKGLYGHVLVAGGSFGKSGAPAMAGLGAYRAGAGLVTIATDAAYELRPELMSVRLAEINATLDKISVLAVGPGLGTGEEADVLVQHLYRDIEKPVVFDADALNLLAADFPSAQEHPRILTPHPGEMGRLAKCSTAEIQKDRLGHAQRFAAEHNVCLVLKGDRTVIAFADGETWINPTGSPSMATGGTGDILTGMIAGLVAQHPSDWKRAVIGAVWLHGRCGELCARDLGEESTLALDLLTCLPEAMQEARAGTG